MSDEKKPKLCDVTRGGTYDLDPRGRLKPEPPPILICRNCGSERITETWQVGVLECMECGAKGKADSGA